MSLPVDEQGVTANEAGRVGDADRVLSPSATEPVPVSALPGDAPSRGRYVECAACRGAGIVTTWSFGVKEPDECSGCYGSGRNWRYPSGLVAKHRGGPFVGRDFAPAQAIEARRAGTGTGPVHESAVPKGCAQ